MTSKTTPTSMPGIMIPELYLPGKNVTMEKWGVIACDQHTSNPHYWEQVYEYVGNDASTLHLMLPELYLQSKDVGERLQKILDTMRVYDRKQLIVNTGPQLTLIERDVASGRRYGLLLAIDLEQYDYRNNSHAFIRASEETIIQRVKPRMQTRNNALFEMSHILMLCNATPETLFTPMLHHVTSTLYDTELMFGGRRIRSYKLTLAHSMEILKKWLDSMGETNGFLLTGDGNHSLAAALAVWEEARAAGAASDDPRRWAMVELVSIHDPALSIYPIHRFVPALTPDEVISILNPSYCTACTQRTSTKLDAKEVILFDSTKGYLLRFDKLEQGLALPHIEQSITGLNSNIDYIHGDNECTDLVQQEKGTVILLSPPERGSIFPFVQQQGCFPKKAFSLGTPEEKRYYMELRKL